MRHSASDVLLVQLSACMGDELDTQTSPVPDATGSSSVRLAAARTYGSRSKKKFVNEEVCRCAGGCDAVREPRGDVLVVVSCAGTDADNWLQDGEPGAREGPGAAALDKCVAAWADGSVLLLLPVNHCASLDRDPAGLGWFGTSDVDASAHDSERELLLSGLCGSEPDVLPSKVWKSSTTEYRGSRAGEDDVRTLDGTNVMGMAMVT